MKPMDRISKEERKAIFAKKMKLLDRYEACMENAGGFIDEAKMLLQYQVFSRAAFLAYCGLEETGKAQIVADYCHGDISESTFKKQLSRSLNKGCVYRASSGVERSSY